jgi:branched-chain amino acid transport system substrate-binding protein
MLTRLLFLYFILGCSTYLQSQDDPKSNHLQQKISVFDKEVEFSGWRGNNTIKVNAVSIGFFFPVNPDNQINASINNAADLAIDEINKAGGYNGLPFRLIKRWSDDPWGAGSKEMIKLVYQDSVWAVIGSLDGAATHVAEQITTKAWLPLISAVSADPTLNYIRIPWIFRLPPGYQSQARMIVNQGIKAQTLKKVGLITSTNHDGRIFAKEVRDAMKEINQSLLFHFQVNTQLKDLSDIAERMLTFKPDALILLLSEQQIIDNISKLQDNDFSMPLFIPWIPGLDMDLLSEINSGNLYVIKSFSQEDNPAWQSFRDKYYSRYRSIPSASAAFTYDAIHLVVCAIEKTGLNRAAIRDAIFHTDYLSPVTGKISWDNSGGNIFQSMILQKFSR